MTTAEPLRESAYEALLQKILDGKLEPESRIIESRLSKDLGVSRTPLREALLRLTREGLLTTTYDHGFRVNGLSKEEAKEIYPLLWKLETLALRESGLLAQTLTEELAQINKKFDKARSSPKSAMLLDTKWHETLISLCKNKTLQEIIQTLRLKAQRYEVWYMGKRALTEHSVRQHEAVIRALNRNNIDVACEALELNWRFGLEVLVTKI